MTIFEKILAKEIPTDIIYEDDHSIAFHDIAPQAPVHVLVIPKRLAKNFSDLNNWHAEDIGHYMQSINNVVNTLNLRNGYRLIFNTQNDGGQTVNYLHAHILGGKSLGWPPFPL